MSLFFRNFKIVFLSIFLLSILLMQGAISQETGDGSFGLFGKDAPDFRAKTITNEDITLSKNKGSVVVLCFWISEAENLKTLIQKLEAINATYQSMGILKIITISLDTDRAKVDEGIKANNITLPVIWDGKGWKGKLPELYNIVGVPRVIVIDKDGKISYSGLQDKDITAAVMSLAGNPNQTTPATAGKENITSGTLLIGSQKPSISPIILPPPSLLDKTNNTTGTAQKVIIKPAPLFPVKARDFKTTDTAKKVLNILGTK